MRNSVTNTANGASPAAVPNRRMTCPRRAACIPGRRIATVFIAGPAGSRPGPNKRRSTRERLRGRAAVRPAPLAGDLSHDLRSPLILDDRLRRGERLEVGEVDDLGKCRGRRQLRRKIGRTVSCFIRTGTAYPWSRPSWPSSLNKYSWKSLAVFGCGAHLLITETYGEATDPSDGITTS